MQLEKIAVLGERKIALGFELVGIKDVFISEDPKGMHDKLFEIINGKAYNLILASDSVEKYLGEDELRSIETMMKPVVIFIPVSSDVENKESVEKLAKRILGIDLSNLKNSPAGAKE
ncbi:A-type Na(+),H(+)-transporting-ATP synthase subunit F [Candidatus Mancarchaeum acidiphilum]|uniref:A-type Na(+),H(+)-transporting-ATP synthase subunit F n=1 Tax=Candidatus Mancarchaeum acidiphilum TaxID=1920749 RepID=A0A218NMH6_9ARCH|nr:V-type ATP synthase subunit F [Candidatus Mancarchaeum acidiphilum]ASI13680.1 A-type Na(+),H(+)-transporting-ATP synthase subunit F [Candidatus Mancarchaeum acidiphilum]